MKVIVLLRQPLRSQHLRYNHMDDAVLELIKDNFRHWWTWYKSRKGDREKSFEDFMEVIFNDKEP